MNNNPWKGLESYKYNDANQFYGRNQELSDLAEIIRRNTFTTIYGISGAGKTSIINAGLCPLLDKEHYLPVPIRLNHGKDRKSYDQQIISATEEALAKIEGEAEKSYDIDLDSEYDQLWLYFHSHTFWTKDNHKIAPVLFIDQFEEIFTKNDDANDIWSFFNVIDSLQYNMPTERILNLIQSTGKSITFGDEPNFRVVFSMREDFLPRLEDFCFDIPAMRRNRVGLKPLNGLQAIEVITKPRPGVVSREVALHIISKVVGRTVDDNPKRLSSTLVDTSILSLFCTELYNYRDKSKNEGVITRELVDLYGGNILEWFYDRNMQILPKKTYVYLEDHLLTHNGFRNSIAIDDLLQNNVTQEQIDILEENRIIRVEDVNHNLRVEFTHDVLCKIAKKRKDARDSLEKAKDEASALRGFTLDTVVFLLIAVYPFINAYFVGFGPWFFVSLMFLPLVGVFYLLFIHKSLSDRNFSIVTGVLAIAVVLGFAGCLKIVSTSDTTPLDIALLVFVALLVYGFGTLPLYYNIYNVFEAKRSTKWWKLLWLVVWLVVPVLTVGGIFIDSFGSLTTIALLSPFVLLLLSPFPIMYAAKKRGKVKPINRFSVYYGGYAVLIVSLLLLDRYRFLPLKVRSLISDSDRSYEDYLAVSLFVSAILTAIYVVAYIRQPKELSLRRYLDNVMDVQSFRKYKSFPVRFKTILICMFILISGIAGFSYIDFIPLVTLPLTALLSLYMVSQETTFTVAKTVLSKKVVAPVLLVSGVLLGLQYVILPFKPLLLLLVCLASAVAIVRFFIAGENAKTNKWLIAKVGVFSLLLTFLLPFLCVGYNMFNPELSSVHRVWGGAVPSDQNRIYFLTIADGDGNKGVMDYSDVIIPPMYDKIEWANLSYEAFEKLYPVSYKVQQYLDHRNEASFYYTSPIVDSFECIEKSYLREWGGMVSFSVIKDGKEVTHNEWDLLCNKNKFGRKISINSLEGLSSRELAGGYYDEYSATNNIVDSLYMVKYSANIKNVATILKHVLSSQNVNISQKEREMYLTRIVVNKLFRNGVVESIHVGEYENAYSDYSYTSSNSSSEPLTQAFIDSHRLGTVDGLSAYKGKGIFDYQVKGTINHLYPIMALDTTGYIRDSVFEKLQKRFAPNFLGSEYAYYLLFGRDAKMARNYLPKNPVEEDDKLLYYVNLCAICYYEGDKAAFRESIVHDGLEDSNSFMNSLISRFQELDFWGVKPLDESYLDEAAELLGLEKYSEKDIKDYMLIEVTTAKEKDEQANEWNYWAYQYAHEYDYDTAINCIDRAIELSPDEPNFYDTKGEIYLMQGKEYEAVEMWRKVISLNPQFLDYYPESKLHQVLSNRNLVE